MTMKINNSKILAIVMALSLLVCSIVGITSVTATASEDEATPQIVSKNIEYGGNFAMMFAVDAATTTSDVKLNVWDANKTFEVTYSPRYTETITTTNGTTYENAYIFFTGEIAAKDMADYYYIQAVDGEAFGEVIRYSVAEYMYERLYDGDTISDSQKELYEATLIFGSKAQKLLVNEKDNDPTNDEVLVTDYKYVRVNEGKIDGYNTGVYPVNSVLVISLNDDNTGWEITYFDDITETVEGNTLTLINHCKAEPVKSQYSEGLEFTLSNDETYYSVTGIGTCTDTDIVIPSVYNKKSVTQIGSAAFYNCKNMTSITIPSSVASIGSSAFYGCNGLTKVKISDLKSWCEIKFSGEFATPMFYASDLYLNETLIKELVIPNGVTNIKEYAFCSCEKLVSVTIPSGVEVVENSAFRGCINLTEITIPDSVVSIGELGFYYCAKLKSIMIGAGATDIDTSAFFWCSKLESIKVSENNTRYKSIDGNLYTKDEKTLLQYSIGKNAPTFTIPSSVTNIGDKAFSYCNNLTSITIPTSVTNIGYMAFLDCDRLTSITLPNSIASIGEDAFCNCDILTTIIIPASVTNISGSIFSSCGMLTSITVDENNENYKSIDGNLYSKDGKILLQIAPGKTDTSFTIPDGVTTIGNSAFIGLYNLKSIVIPATLTAIGNDAFWCCYELTSLTFHGTILQWDSVVKSYNWDYKAPLSQIICSDGTITINT